MKWLGYREVKLSAIVVDAADVRARMKAPHVAELAVDIKARGGDPIHAPTVRAGKMTLLCGRDRFAALSMLKARRIWAHVVECDDTEAKELELAENIYRRADNRSELIAQLVALKEQQIRAVAENKGGTVSQLAPQTVTANARKEVARAAGVSTAAVRKAQQRAAGAAAKDSDGSAGHGAAGEPPTGPLMPLETPGAVAPKPTIDLLGIPEDAVGQHLLRGAAEQQRIIDETDQLLRRAQFVLAGLRDAGYSPARAGDIKAQVQRVASLVRGGRPVALCPYCKGATGDGSCDSTGLATKDEFDRAPAELKDPANPRVAHKGQFVPWTREFLTSGVSAARTSTESKLATKPAKATEEKPRKLTIELPDGTTYDPEEPWSPPGDIGDEGVPF